MSAPQQFQMGLFPIEAMQWEAPDDDFAITAWIVAGGGTCDRDLHVAGYTDAAGQDWGLFKVETDRGWLDIHPQDWLIQDSDGRFWAVPADLFAAISRPRSDGADAARAVPPHISQNLAKLAVLCLAEEGWDTGSSQPVQRRAVAGYLESGLWAAAGDGEPMLTGEGEIRLELERGGDDHTAEIGSLGMYLARLRDAFEDCDYTAPAFDADTLIDFVAGDVMPSQEDFDADAVSVFDTLSDRLRSCAAEQVHRRAVRAASAQEPGSPESDAITAAVEAVVWKFRSTAAATREGEDRLRRRMAREVIEEYQRIGGAR